MLKNCVILCVDDEPIILTSLRSQLFNEFGKNYLIEVAESGEEGLEVLYELTDSDYNLLIVISDWLMPGMKGDEFLIKVHQKFPDIIKIMLSGHADKEAVERAKREANLKKFIYKPWDAEDLIETIKINLKEFGGKNV